MGLFDGSVKGNPSICGNGVVLFLNEQNWISFKEGLSKGTNNFAELGTLKLLLLRAIEYGCKSLQVFGDSMVIINWENGIQCCHNLILLPIFEDIVFIKQHFDSLSITHVDREQNALTNSLSKDRAQLPKGEVKIERKTERDLGGFYHRPFHDMST